MAQKFPLYYFPSTVCWIDDDKLLLDVYAHVLSEHYNYKPFTNPMTALEYITNYKSPIEDNNILSQQHNCDDANNSTQIQTKINISNLNKIQQIKNRSSELSVIIIDQNMPHMSGLELCKQSFNPI